MVNRSQATKKSTPSAPKKPSPRVLILLPSLVLSVWRCSAQEWMKRIGKMLPWWISLSWWPWLKIWFEETDFNFLLIQWYGLSYANFYKYLGLNIMCIYDNALLTRKFPASSTWREKEKLFWNFLVRPRFLYCNLVLANPYISATNFWRGWSFKEMALLAFVNSVYFIHFRLRASLKTKLIAIFG